jgi:hypothetical protein
MSSIHVNPELAVEAFVLEDETGAEPEPHATEPGD